MKPSDKKTPPGRDEMAAKLLSVDEAKQKILDSVIIVTGEEKLAIRSTLDRVLATDIQSTINVPPYDNSAMDGYAIMHNDLQPAEETCLQLVGESFAGKPYAGTMKPGQTIRIMTGAVIPDGADTIIMQEHARREDNNVFFTSAHKKGDHVRCIGEDMKTGETILTRGKQVTPAELGLLASLGIPEVKVMRKIRVAFFSTGDELRSVGEPLLEGQIYDSNRYTLYGMLKRLGVDIIDMGVIADRREDVRKAFQEASMIADAVITSGGVSVGEADFVKDTLEELGQVNFWRVAMKPGKPLAIGRINNAAFFGVPGNPVSTMATFYQFVQPALKKMMGISDSFNTLLKVVCTSNLKKAVGRLEYQRGILSYDAEGELIVSSTGVQGSHILTSMSRANCFIILPADNTGISPGDKVQVQPFSDLV
jgi:molybdopterin molybdotransferase